MIDPADVALVLLAAGQSRRFGPTDKLAAALQGQPLGLHVVGALAGINFGQRVAVVSGTALDFAGHGYRVIANDDLARGLSHSVRLGVETARAAGANAVLIVLADMPCVTAAHVLRLLGGYHDAASVIASGDGGKPGPPALFGASHFDVLMTQTGDQGGRALIRTGVQLAAPPGELTDVDTIDDLNALHRALGA